MNMSKTLTVIAAICFSISAFSSESGIRTTKADDLTMLGEEKLLRDTINESRINPCQNGGALKVISAMLENGEIYPLSQSLNTKAELKKERELFQLNNQLSRRISEYCKSVQVLSEQD
ncbi:MAG: hypothetical protein KDD38_08145 [Bdellovibrionales bacterium]|nr:hypothetical protein [Bdellovibrionales bacterium]